MYNIDLYAFIKSKGLSQTQFSEQTGIERSQLSRIIHGKASLLEKHINKILNAFPDFKSYLEAKKGEMVKRIYAPQEIYETENGRRIPFYNTDVFATISPAMADTVALKPDTFINIPMFAHGDFALQVTGNSMKGLINHGDWIVVKRITNRNAIIYGEIYLVVTKSDNLKTVKFVKEHENENLLWLIPYNIEQFQAQTIEKEEILEMYIVSGLFRSI